MIPAARQIRCCAAGAVGNTLVGAGLDEMPHRLLMSPAAVSQNYGLDQSGPAEIVDVIERAAGTDENLDDISMSKMRRGDQCRAVIWACDKIGPIASGERGIQHIQIVGDGGNRHHVVGIIVESVWVGAGAGECRDHVFVRGEGCNMQRRPSVSISPLQISPFGDQVENRLQVAVVRSAMKGVECSNLLL